MGVSVAQWSGLQRMWYLKVREIVKRAGSCLNLYRARISMVHRTSTFAAGLFSTTLDGIEWLSIATPVLNHSTLISVVGISPDQMQCSSELLPTTW